MVLSSVTSNDISTAFTMLITGQLCLFTLEYVVLNELLLDNTHTHNVLLMDGMSKESSGDGGGHSNSELACNGLAI